MEYQSFYGGRRGTPFILKAVFKNLTELIDDFKKESNPSPCGVGYSEYAMINTEDKSDETNGMIYQRLFSGEASYVGQIVGPEGQTPRTVFFDYDEIEKYNTTYYKREFRDSNGIEISEDKITSKVIKDDDGNYIVEYYYDEIKVFPRYYEIDTTDGSRIYKDEELENESKAENIIHLADGSYYQTETKNDTNAFQLIPGGEVTEEVITFEKHSVDYVVNLYGIDYIRFQNKSDSNDIIYKILSDASGSDVYKKENENKDGLIDFDGNPNDYEKSVKFETEEIDSKEYFVLRSNVNDEIRYQFEDKVYKKKENNELEETSNPEIFRNINTIDTIQYKIVNFKDVHGNTQGNLIGFKIPYLINTFSAESIDMHYKPSIEHRIENGVQVDKDHPFFNDWVIKIPKGIHGKDIDSIELKPLVFKVGTPLYSKESDGTFRNTELCLSQDLKLNTNDYSKFELGYYPVEMGEDTNKVTYYLNVQNLESEDNEEGLIFYLKNYDSGHQEGEKDYIIEKQSVPFKSIVTTSYTTVNDDSSEGLLTIYYSDNSTEEIPLLYPKEFFINNHLDDNDKDWKGDQKVYLKYPRKDPVALGEPLTSILDVIVINSKESKELFEKTEKGQKDLSYGDVMILYSSLEKRNQDGYKYIGEGKFKDFNYLCVGSSKTDFEIEYVKTEPTEKIPNKVYYLDSSDKKGYFLGSGPDSWIELDNFSFNVTEQKEKIINVGDPDSYMNFVTDSIKYATWG